MDYQSRYDELDEIIDSIDILVDKITDKDYIERLNEIKFDAQNELDEVSDKLQEEYDREEKQREKEYWEGVI